MGLCPPEPWGLDDGGSFVPGAHQRWLWEAWKKVWDEAQQIRERESAVLHWFNLGDGIDGHHHDSPQVVTSREMGQSKIFERCAEVPLSLRPDHIVAIRGTEAHAGRSGQYDDAVFDKIADLGHPVTRDPATGAATWWHYRREIGGLLIDATHHGKMSKMPQGRGPYMRAYAERIWNEHARNGERPPDICLRGHNHKKGDSGPPLDIPTRALALPCFQLATTFGHKVAPDSTADIGGVIITIRNREAEVRFVTSKVDRNPTLEPL